VPNPQAQAAAIRATLARAGIDARTISYVEAHGTGTALGDPIEIAGLSKAFATGARQFCAIGSVKSNIGHCESAAGIAGLTKVLLQLRHGELVASLHARELNRHIAFAQTPFYVQRELSAWRRPRPVVEGVERDYPRRAGLSSFGAGGSNAHAIVEEYQAPRRPPSAIGDGVEAAHAAFVLSAKSDERLRALVARWLSAVKAGRYGDADLADMAYTSQIGRVAMPVRLGLVARSLDDLAAKLTPFLHGEQVDGVFHANGAEAGNGKTSAVDLSAARNGLSTRRDLEAAVANWVNGAAIDWRQFHVGSDRRRISLPTYPFEKVHCWFDDLDLCKNGMEAAKSKTGSSVTKRDRHSRKSADGSHGRH
jgi:acyl transferase domain-containing protein